MTIQKSIFIIGIIVFSWFVRLHYFRVPLERDEGEYAYIAKTIERGGVPYRDAFNQKPPAIFFTYYAIFKVFGERAQDLRLGLYFYNLISAFMLYMLARMIFGNPAGALAAFIFVFVTSERRLLAHAANTEIFMLLPMILSWFFALKESGGGAKEMVNIFLAGFFSCTALLYKQVAAANYAGIIIFYLYSGLARKENFKDILKKLCLSISGFLLPLLAVIGYFSLNGALGDFLYQVLYHNIEYSNIMKEIFPQSHLVGHFINTFLFIAQSQAAWWVLAAMSFVFILRSDKRDEKAVLIWFIVSLAGVSAGFRFTLHYFLQAMPALSMLAGYGIVKVFAYTRKIRIKPVRPLIRAAFVALIIALPAKANSYYYSLTPGQLAYVIYSDSPFREAVNVSGYIRQNSADGEEIFVLGSEPEIYFYSGRKSVSKYIFTYPLTYPYSDVLKKQKEVVSAVKSRKPAFILYVLYPFSFSFAPDTPTYLVDEMNNIVEENYRLDGIVIGGQEPQYIYGAQSRENFGYLDGLKANKIYIYRRI
jgi:4-amino-4-deoxy-L-arabinose transferase-like glycosyltransferase